VVREHDLTALAILREFGQDLLSTPSVLLHESELLGFELALFPTGELAARR